MRGVKTGYFKAAGFSIVATAKRKGVRIIAIVLGSVDRKVRDAKASELIAIGFAKVPSRAEPEPVIKKPAVTSKPDQSSQTAPVQEAIQIETPQPDKAEPDKKAGDRLWGRDLLMIGIGFAAGVAFCLAFALFTSRSRSGRRRRLM